MTNKDYLIHYGVLGMRWGVRRYQNYDGTRIGAKNRKKNDYGLIDHYKVKVRAKIDNTKSLAKNVSDIVTGKDSIKKAAKDHWNDIQKSNDALKSSYDKLSKGEKAAVHAISSAALVAQIAVPGCIESKLALKGKKASFKILEGGKKKLTGDIPKEMKDLGFDSLDDVKKVASKHNKVTEIGSLLEDTVLDKKNNIEKIIDFNPHYRPDASNCRQATSEFLCKKYGINCTAKAAEIKDGRVLTGLDPHDLFPDSLIHSESIPKKSLDSETSFNKYLSDRFKSLCGDKDGCGSLTIKLKEYKIGDTTREMKHNLSWEVKDGAFRIVDTDGAINRSYFSTISNNTQNHLSGARNIEFFKAEGEINMDAVEKQVIRK